MEDNMDNDVKLPTGLDSLPPIKPTLDPHLYTGVRGREYTINLKCKVQEEPEWKKLTLYYESLGFGDDSN